MIFVQIEEWKQYSWTHEFVLYLSQRLDLRSLNKHVLRNLSIYYTWKNIRQYYTNSKLKIIAPPGNDEFELPDGSYSMSVITDYIEYIIKKNMDQYPLIALFIFTWARLITDSCSKWKIDIELQTPETMKLFGSTKKLDKLKNVENELSLEVVEVGLLQYNLVDNQYQQNFEVL